MFPDEGTITSYSKEGEAIITATACDGSDVCASIKVIVQENSGVYGVPTNNPITVYIENESILIIGKKESDIVEIFNIHGQHIISTTNSTIPMNTKGLYFVKIVHIPEHTRSLMKSIS